MTEAPGFTASGHYRLGETPGEHRVTRAADNADAALALARQARFSLRLFSHDLDPRLYSTADFVAAIRAFVLRDKRTFMRILVQDPSRAVHGDHRLIDTIQSMPSHIGIRRVRADEQDEPCTFLLADERGLLRRPLSDQFEGTVDFHAGPRAREMRRWFDEAWEHSEPDPEFRWLSL